MTQMMIVVLSVGMLTWINVRYWRERRAMTPEQRVACSLDEGDILRTW